MTQIHRLHRPAGAWDRVRDMEHDEGTLKLTALDVVYEVQMLIHTADSLPGGRREVRSVADRNVFLESFLLHARVVDEFLRSTPKRDDVAAFHYLSAWTGGPMLSAAERTAIDKQLAHLTASRRNKTPFSVTSIARRLAGGFVTFCERLADENDDRALWFSEGRLTAVGWLQHSREGLEGLTATSIDEVSMTRS